MLLLLTAAAQQECKVERAVASCLTVSSTRPCHSPPFSGVQRPCVRSTRNARNPAHTTDNRGRVALASVSGSPIPSPHPSVPKPKGLYLEVPFLCCCSAVGHAATLPATATCNLLRFAASATFLASSLRCSPLPLALAEPVVTAWPASLANPWFVGLVACALVLQSPASPPCHHP